MAGYSRGRRGRQLWGAWVALWLLVGAAYAADFYPVAIDTTTGLPAAAEDFTPAAECAYCHPVQHAQWSGSMHANAYRDPIFRAAWREAAPVLGDPGQRVCAGCHTPVGQATEAVWVRRDGDILVPEFAREGVTCDFCHSVRQVTLPGAGGDAGLRVDPRGPKLGPYADAVSTFHATEFSFLHTQSEFCAACHAVFHVAGGATLARTYAEWQGSVYAASEIHCQDCHMVPPEVAAEVARSLVKPTLTGVTSSFETERTPFYEHRFTGANAAVPGLLGHHAVGREAAARVQHAARLEVAVDQYRLADRTLQFSVRVENVGAGHNLPTSMPELRQLWLHVTLAGAEGAPLWENGALTAAGALPADSRRFGVRGLDASGRATWKPWEIARVAEDTTIPPRGVRTETFRVQLAAAPPGELELVARLNYRSYPQAVSDRYLGTATGPVPVVEAAVARLPVRLGGEP